MVIQPATPVPPRGYLRDIALSMQVGDMVVCQPTGRTGSNRYYSRLHRMLTSLGMKARSERVVTCAKCGTVKDHSIRRAKCVQCGAFRKLSIVRTWRTG